MPRASTDSSPDAVAIATLTESQKLGDVYATHASQASCDPSCPFLKGGGCYAEGGNQKWTTWRLNKAVRRVKASWREIAHQEAAALRRLPPNGLAARLHIVGDCRTNTAARIVSSAIVGRIAWTFTHSWRKVLRASWGAVSVLASCERWADVEKAHARGYAAALVVAAFPEKPERNAAGFLGVPCPEQTGKAETCVHCRLCWDAERLHRNRLVILFEPITAPNKVRKTLARCGG